MSDNNRRSTCQCREWNACRSMTKEKLLASLLSLAFLGGCAVAFKATHSSGELELDLKPTPSATDKPGVQDIQSENA